MPAPLIEFAQFAHPQRWWLRRGPPPWLDDRRWWARAFRVTLVLALMGTASGWLTVAGFLLIQLIEPLLGGNQESLEIFLGLWTGPGLWFGVGVLIPLSRWLGRGWVLAVLSVPASMLACYCGVVMLLAVDPVMSSGPSEFPGGERASGFYAGFVGAGIVGVWMGHPLRKSAWLAAGLATVLATLGCGLLFLNENGIAASLSPLGGLAQWTSMAAPYVTFQSLAAIGLGARLWRPGGSES